MSASVANFGHHPFLSNVVLPHLGLFTNLVLIGEIYIASRCC